MLSSDYYSIKEADYFSHARYDLIKLIPQNPENRVLEIGASGGYTLLAIKAKALARECVGIELFNLPDTQQNNPAIDRMIIGDIENPVFSLPSDYFDVIICGDVLEHLKDPWTVLEKITGWLKPNGIIIISTPNFRYFKAAPRILLKADFRYTGWGVMDKTHMRFFCKRNIQELASTGNLELEHIYSSIYLQNQRFLRNINRFTLGLFKDFITGQYITVSRKK